MNKNKFIQNHVISQVEVFKMPRLVIDKPTLIQGNGADLTILEMTEDVLFDIAMDEDAHVTIRDLTIRVVDKQVESAIRYDGSSQADHHPHVSLVADRLSPRLTIERVNIESKGSGRMSKAINIINGLGVNIDKCSFNQSDRVREGIAINLEGYYQPVEFNITNSRINNYRVGIKSSEAEGLKIIGNNIVANTLGIQVKNESSQPEVNISDNHISSDLHNLHLTKSNNVSIEGNLFFRREGDLSRSRSSSVFMQECRNSIVVGNIFTSGNWYHIHTRHCENITVGANNHSNGFRTRYDDSRHFKKPEA